MHFHCRVLDIKRTLRGGCSPDTARQVKLQAALEQGHQQAVFGSARQAAERLALQEAEARAVQEGEYQQIKQKTKRQAIAKVAREGAGTAEG